MPHNPKWPDTSDPDWWQKETGDSFEVKVEILGTMPTYTPNAGLPKFRYHVTLSGAHGKYYGEDLDLHKAVRKAYEEYVRDVT